MSFLDVESSGDCSVFLGRLLNYRTGWNLNPTPVKFCMRNSLQHRGSH
ncbi:hypothetical protein SLEP1_g35576 [Rubroshorea leprosula]|uniref:Uncharacterized protein n=1 Tax=Rubroshorea leprosula TaxID=152421 RepID=A0AAV5KNV0_9ROSI|nr:hypothetical protein SLEP1_g35576 [Rubroshorea leprosula]